MPQWLIYALGGGFGHLTRACALARAATAKVQVRILTNSPYAAGVRNALPELDIIALDPAIAISDARIEVVRQIELTNPECLIVDTFPRGLGGELADVVPSFHGKKVFVHRDLNPRYVAAFDLTAFVRNYYDLVVVPGDVTAFERSVATAPWLIRSADELPKRDEVRALLSLDGERPCIIVCAAGNPDELDWYGSVTAHLVESTCDVRCIAPLCPATCPPECWLSYWPAIDLYNAADVVVGGAGYNTVNECLACGVPLIARAWPRKYDRQGLRATNAAIPLVVDPREAAISALRTIATAGMRPSRPQFVNGALEAVTAIESASWDGL